MAELLNRPWAGEIGMISLFLFTLCVLHSEIYLYRSIVIIQYQGNINQWIMQATMDALVDRSRSVNGVPTSLADLGYSDAGLDDVWQKCGSYGPQNWTYHDAQGNPVVNTETFPDLKAMTTYAHDRNLTAGWYGNNCDCHDHCKDVICFEADVNATLAYGFDSIKLDGCGQEENVEQWYNL